MSQSKNMKYVIPRRASCLMFVMLMCILLSMNTTDINKDDSCCAEHPNTGRKGRNLVVCVDGTSNQFGERVTIMLVEIYALSYFAIRTQML
ncbi:hypothetical protein SERLADRAFT_470906 [Serpula lacrymans var. lacrymans S7.9]|uniref:DUF2235 domain-containing protein n=1 Tax=Serpula lacrymans var. lacrymans (strain S7.9) TaxID=578457 RepID=F8P059_SERL9|nr:uncharacterized protein SERLADRAFT_470906 [Serpula lacrymans var. lacrymans S7.9]EGO24126.1 hypothetical protein SERLADRAFT_470906 [Serpula lacrymans var. lacrymans S7.9]